MTDSTAAAPLVTAFGGQQPPTWVGLVTDDVLREEMGPDTFDRGAAYHRSGAVTTLHAGKAGRVLVASVRGSRGRTYQTVVTAEEDLGPDEPVYWDGRCTCPMRDDCKHVAAVILTARSRLRAVEHVAPSWEAAFTGLVRPASAATDVAPLALHLEVFAPRSSRYAGPPPAAPRLRLRPVTAGKNGGWIRTGVSWRDLEYGFGGYGRIQLDPTKREAAMALLYAARAHARHGFYAVEQHLQADDLGPRLWKSLREVEQAGIPLVSGTKGEVEVRLEAAPATVVLDARQDPAGDVALTARLPLPGRDEVPGGQLDDQEVHFVGDPPHGLFGHQDGRLVLAAIDPPLDRSLRELVTRRQPLRIPAAEVAAFLGRYYPVLRRRVTVQSSDASVTFPEIQPPRLALSVRFEAGHETDLSWSFQYAVGSETLDVPVVGGPDASSAAPRDEAAEAALLASLDVLDAVPGLRERASGGLRLVPQTRLHGLDTARFVADVMPALEARDDVAVTVDGSPADYVEAEDAPLIRVSATDSDGPVDGDWFDLGITVTIGGEEVPFMPLFTALATGETHLILESGTWFSLDRPELHTLRRLIEEARSLQDRPAGPLRVTRWQAGLWDELVSLGEVAHQSERWSRTVGALLHLETLPKPPPPTGLTAELRDYQLDGYHWLSLLWDHQLGGILADDMGLGKTVQTLAMAARALERGTLTPDAPILVVTPTSVVSTWLREAARFCPDLRVAAVTETRGRSGQSLAEATAGAHLVVTSFALVRLDEDAFRELSWSGLVLDEAQFVKNHQAKTYQCARRLPAPFKLAITGTPLENSLMDLWALLSIVAPGLFPNPQRFTELYRKPIESGQSPELLATLRRRIRPLMLRRTKDEVARDLPPKIEQVLSVTLNSQQQRIYQTHLQRERQRVLRMLQDVDRNRIAILRSLTVLRQLSLDVSLVEPDRARVRSSKIDALMEQLGEVVAEGHRVLVFSQFTRFLSLVRERLREEGIDHAYLDGRTRDRARRIAEFTDGDAPVFLISLRAGGAGLTLTEADYVFVLDPWWNPAVEAQAVDRTHRIGQDKTVMVYRLVAEGTIEEKVVALQQRKRDLFTRVVDAEGLMGAPLSAEDIRGLFEG